MQEIELKFQIPEGALSAIEAELQALAGGPLTPQVLKAAYFDTAQRALAQARSALRVRQEDSDWVQTLKCGGSNTMLRLEDNQVAEAPADGQPIRARLSLHLGRPAEANLRAALGWTPDTDADGEQCGLIQLYRTDMQRCRARVRVGAGTPDEGVVELALDRGLIQAGPFSLPVRELEIELVSGSAQAVIHTAHDWVRRHGLWLDTQTKAHRGDRLARRADTWRANGSPALPDDACSGLAAVTDAGRATALRPHLSGLAEAPVSDWWAALEGALEVAQANQSELATLTPSQAQAVTQAWLAALLRLRALARCWPEAYAPGAAATWQAAAELTRALRHRGHHATEAVALARSNLATSLSLDLLTALLRRPA